MATDGQQEVSVPFSFDDPAPAEALAANVEVAKAELAEETGLALEGGAPSTPPELEGILSKYESDPVKLAAAYKAMQQEYSRLRHAKGQDAEVNPLTQQEVAPGDDPPPPILEPEKLAELQSSLFDAAGNEARYHAVGAWAKTNLTPERLAQYNLAIASGDTATALVHFKAMQYDFTKAQGYNGRLVGGRAPNNDVKGFGSNEEIVNAMSDPRYNPQSPTHDPSYHKQVIERISASR